MVDVLVVALTILMTALCFRKLIYILAEDFDFVDVLIALLYTVVAIEGWVTILSTLTTRIKF